MKYLLFMFCVFYSITSRSSSDLLLQGNELLTNKKYKEALSIYKQIEQNNLGGPGLFKNMSLAATSIGNDAEAILYIEKALKYAPNNLSFQSDLQVLRKANPELIDPIKPFFIIDWLNAFIGLLSVNGWTYLSLFLLSLLASYIVIKYPNIKDGKHYQLTILTFVLCFIISIAAANQRQKHINNHKGIIIIEPNSKLQMGPDEVSPVIEELPLGSKVFYNEHLDDWWHVITEQGDDGWIKSTVGKRI